MIEIRDTIKSVNDADRIISKVYSVIINTDAGQIIFGINNKDSMSVTLSEEISDLRSIPTSKIFQIDGNYSNMIIIN